MVLDGLLPAIGSSCCRGGFPAWRLLFFATEVGGGGTVANITMMYSGWSEYDA